MHNSSTSTTIYVGNIQSITDEQLREYFQRFGKVEACYHNCTRAADQWLIDYRFIKFSSDTNMNSILTNKIDHMIARIRLDVHSYEVAFSDDTRLVLDRKICIAHTDPKINRNRIKKSFSRYGRILNCTCVSSGNGLEHVYIEYESVNSIRAIFSSNQHHRIGPTSIAVKQPLRPSQAGVKQELISHDEKCPYPRHRLGSNFETAQYSSVLVNHHNRIIENELRTSNLSSESQRRLSVTSNVEESQDNASTNSTNNISLLCSQEQLKGYENEYGLVIRRDLDEITYQIDKFLQNQTKSYKQLHKYILDEISLQTSSSSSEDGEIRSRLPSSKSENSKPSPKKRVKSQH